MENLAPNDQIGEMNSILAGLTSSGKTLDLGPENFGELRRSDDVLPDPEALRTRLQEDGYLYVPGFFPRDQIARVRREFLQRIHQAGALHPDYPIEAAIPAPQNRANPRQMVPDNAALLGVVFGESLIDFYRGIFGGEIRHFDHIWSRVVAPGHGTPPHADAVYMNRGTLKLLTAWIPYGDVTREIGGLMILEKSHQQQERMRSYLAGDVDTYCANRGPYKHKSGWLSNNPVTLRERFGGRWLTTNFQMGDLLTFGMATVHASLDNQSECYRLSTDTRYQPATEPIDPRWVGPNTEEYAERNRIGKIC